jgi:hypothetical protein
VNEITELTQNSFTRAVHWEQEVRMTHSQKSRVTVDFPLSERDALDVLCEADLRPPAEQIRWLVINEVKRRGIEMHQPMQNRAGEGSEATPSAVAQKPINHAR